MMKEKSRRWRAASLLAAVLLAVLTLGGCGEAPLVRTWEDLNLLAAVNQQLQDVFAPQLKGVPILSIWRGQEEGGDFHGSLEFLDPRLFYLHQEYKLVRLKMPYGRCEFAVTGDKMEVQNYRLGDSVDLTNYYPTRFYQDFLIPREEFFKNNMEAPSVDLAQIAVDETRLEDEAYRDEARDRMNSFFGTEYTTDIWKSELKGKYAVVFSLDWDRTGEENLALLAELDRIEGLNVTGIYYDSREEFAMCKPLRADDPVNPETLDPRESLRMLAARPDLANLLLTSEFYGMPEIDFFGKIQDYGEEDGQVSLRPIGACVVLDRNTFLSPEMAEAINGMCERCLNVWLLDNSY